MLGSVLLALSLSIDAALIAALATIGRGTFELRWALYVALVFALFHGAALLVGVSAGSALLPWVQSLDHWIALVLFGGLGTQQWLTAVSDPNRPPSALDRLLALLAYAAVSSLDALVAGFGLRALGLASWLTTYALGITVFGLCLVAARFAARLTASHRRLARAAAGTVLIGLGLTVFMLHLQQGV